jgi:hypothetical protein
MPVYLATLAPDMTWAHHGSDGAELVTAAVTLGVPHPPGYPLYVLLGKGISLLPVGSIYFRFNLLSALCAASAAAIISVLVLQRAEATTAAPLSARKWWIGPAAVVTGVTLALMPLVWSQAIIAEVYALNMLLLALFLWSLMSRAKVQHPWLGGALLGLAVTAHLTSILMLPLALGLIPAHRWRTFAAGLLFGLLPFCVLPLFAAGSSPIVWSDPTTLSGWVWLVAARLYHPNAFAASPVLLIERVGHWGIGLGRQFAWFGLVLLGAGIWRSWRYVRSSTVLLLGTVLAYGVYALGYRSEDAAVLLLPALLLLSVLLAEGIIRFGPLALTLPLTLLLLNFNRVDLSGDFRARELGQAVLETAPPEALLLADGDHTTFTLWYLQYVEGMRRDVAIVDSNLLMFDWYRQRLASTYPDLSRLDRDDLPAFRAANEENRPFCTVSLPRTPTDLLDYDC